MLLLDIIRQITSRAVYLSRGQRRTNTRYILNSPIFLQLVMHLSRPGTVKHKTIP